MFKVDNGLCDRFQHCIMVKAKFEHWLLLLKCDVIFVYWSIIDNKVIIGNVRLT